MVLLKVLKFTEGPHSRQARRIMRERDKEAMFL